MIADHGEQTAIQLLTRKYSVLRSTIVVENGTPYMQEFEPSSTCPSIQFVTNGDAHLDTRAIMGILRRAFRFPEDLAVRWCIVRLQSGIQLYLTAHHIAVDGGSMSLLSKEFLEIYRGGSTTTDDSTMDFSQAHIAEVLPAKIDEQFCFFFFFLFADQSQAKLDVQ